MKISYDMHLNMSVFILVDRSDAMSVISDVSMLRVLREAADALVRLGDITRYCTVKTARQNAYFGLL